MVAFEFIVRSFAERDRPPTIRELGEVLGSTSTNYPVEVLNALERKGWIRRVTENRRRRIVRPAHRAPDGKCPRCGFNLVEET